MVQAHNNLSDRFNKFKYEVDSKESENVLLKKRVEELEATYSIQNAELKELWSKVEQLEDKSMSIKLFTTVKVRAEMVKEFKEGKTSDWDPEAAFSAWEKMKLLYLDFEGEEDQEMAERADCGQSGPSGAEYLASGSGAAAGEDVVVE